MKVSISMFLAAAATATLATTGVVLADDAPSPSPSLTPAPVATPHTLGSIIVTAQRYPTTIHGTPRESYVIFGSELTRLGAPTVADVLRLLPGVVVNAYGTIGHLQTALLRGASSTETLVLVNGRPANEPGVGLFDFSSLPSQAIERVEVVEGAASTLYGSAAMGGVMNIITRDPAGSGGSASVTLGYQGASSNGLDVVALDKRGAGIRVDYSSQHARESFSYPPAFGSAGGSLPNNDASDQDVFVSLANSERAPMQMRAHLGDDTSDVGEPGSLLFGAPSAFARQQRDYLRGDFSLERKTADGDISLQLYSDGQRIHYYDGTSDPANFILPFDTLSHLTTRGIGIRDTMTSNYNTLIVGYDSRSDRAQFEANFGGFPAAAPANAATTGIYVSDEVSGPGRMTWTIGAREERPQGFNHTIVPSVGAMYRDPGRDAGVRANYGRAFRIPALEETSSFFFGNPSLEPEYAATFDVGIFSHENALTYFGARASNLIVSSPPAFVPANVSIADIRGINASMRVPLRRDDQLQLNYTNYLRANDETNGSRLPFRPSATGSLGYSRVRGAWSFGSTLFYSGRRYANDPNTILMPQYATIGAYVRRGAGSTSVTLRFDNITGERVELVPGYPVVGRTISVTLSSSWF